MANFCFVANVSNCCLFIHHSFGLWFIQHVKLSVTDYLFPAPVHLCPAWIVSIVCPLEKPEQGRAAAVLISSWPFLCSYKSWDLAPGPLSALLGVHCGPLSDDRPWPSCSWRRVTWSSVCKWPQLPGTPWTEQPTPSLQRQMLARTPLSPGTTRLLRIAGKQAAVQFQACSHHMVPEDNLRSKLEEPQWDDHLGYLKAYCFLTEEIQSCCGWNDLPVKFHISHQLHYVQIFLVSLYHHFFFHI